MYHTWNGPYGEQGQKDTPGKTEKHVKIRGNKGVMRAHRARKRQEADERNARAVPERRRKAREHMQKVMAERIASLPDGEYIVVDAEYPVV